MKEWQVYGSSFFFVEPQMNVDLPEEVFLAVNPKGILIINPDTKEVLSTHPYSEVPTWGHSSTSFVLHIGNLVKQSKMYFSTPNGREINDLVSFRVSMRRCYAWKSCTVTLIHSPLYTHLTGRRCARMSTT